MSLWIESCRYPEFLEAAAVGHERTPVYRWETAKNRPKVGCRRTVPFMAHSLWCHGLFRDGEILDAVDNLKIRDKTVVVWLSDNGPEYFYPWHGTAGPWRGNYFTAWEGSMRAPYLIRWPAKIPAGSVSNEIVHVVDMLPTLGKIAGYDVPDDHIIDGVDQLDFFTGKQEKSNLDGFIVYNNDDIYGYKWGNWKMHLVELENMNSEPKPLNVPRI